MSMLKALNQLRGRLTISIEHQTGFGLGQAGINRRQPVSTSTEGAIDTRYSTARPSAVSFRAARSKRQNLEANLRQPDHSAR